jgi:hypothetical protein
MGIKAPGSSFNRGSDTAARCKSAPSMTMKSHIAFPFAFETPHYQQHVSFAWRKCHTRTVPIVQNNTCSLSGSYHQNRDKGGTCAVRQKTDSEPLSVVSRSKNEMYNTLCKACAAIPEPCESNCYHQKHCSVTELDHLITKQKDEFDKFISRTLCYAKTCSNAFYAKVIVKSLQG